MILTCLLISRCFYQLPLIKSCRRVLSPETTKTLVNSFVVSSVNCCNPLLASTTASNSKQVSASVEHSSEDHLRRKLVWSRHFTHLRQAALIAHLSDNHVQTVSANIQESTQTGTALHRSLLSASVIVDIKKWSMISICQTCTRSSHTCEVWWSQLCHSNTSCTEESTTWNVTRLTELQHLRES